MEHSLGLVLQKLIQVGAAIAGTGARVEQVGNRAAQTGFLGIAEGLAQARAELGRIDEMVAGQVTAVQDAIELIQRAANEPSPDQVVSALSSVQVGELVTGLGAVVPALDRLASQVEASLRGGRPGPLLALIGELRRLVVETIAVLETASRKIGEAIARARQSGGGSALVGAGRSGGADGQASEPTDGLGPTDQPIASARQSGGTDGSSAPEAAEADADANAGAAAGDVDVPEEDDWTGPTGPLGGAPTGPPTKIGRRQDDDVRRSLKRENDAALILADQAYRTHQNPTPQQVADARARTGDIGRPTSKPDYLIEGRVFDCYSPSPTRSVRGVWDAVVEKVEDKQSQRFVINLQDWAGDRGAVARQFAEWPIGRLKELKVVTRDGDVVQIRLVQGRPDGT